MDLPNYKMVDLSIVFCMFTRGYPLFPSYSHDIPMINHHWSPLIPSLFTTINIYYPLLTIVKISPLLFFPWYSHDIPLLTKQFPPLTVRRRIFISCPAVVICWSRQRAMGFAMGDWRRYQLYQLKSRYSWFGLGIKNETKPGIIMNCCCLR